MKQIEIVKKGDRWVAESTSGVIAKTKTKQAAVRRAATTAKADKQSVYVRIHKANGRIQEERTYPKK